MPFSLNCYPFFKLLIQNSDIIQTSEPNKMIEGGAIMTQNTNSKKIPIITALYTNRIIVSKGNATPLNLPVLVGIILLLFIPWLVVTGVVVALALGCRLSVEKSPTEFDGTFDSMIKRTAEDVKNTVVDIGQEPVEEHA